MSFSSIAYHLHIFEANENELLRIINCESRSLILNKWVTISLVIFLILFAVIQIFGWNVSNSEEDGYMFMLASLIVSVPTQTKLLVDVGVILTAILQGFAGINLFFTNLFDPIFGIELLDEEFDFSISRTPREKRVQNLKSILDMIIKEKIKLQRLRNKQREVDDNQK